MVTFDLLLVDSPLALAELAQRAKDTFGDMVKAVVDVQKKVMVIGGELHADCEQELLKKQGSKQADLWGINLYPDVYGDGTTDEWIEFDSMINLRPYQGNRSLGVEDEATRQQIVAIVTKLITR